jgi:hypothetical protein
MNSSKPRHAFSRLISWWPFLIIILTAACQKFEPERVIRLSTGPVTNLGATSVNIAGNIGDVAGQEVISRGICYNDQPRPTLLNAYTIEGSGKGEFTSYIYGLAPEVTYYARAYATNNSLTIYGNEISFTTTDIMVWQKSLGGAGDDRGFSVAMNTGGNYFVTGVSNSTSGDITGNHGNQDIWIVKLSVSGDKMWQNSFGGSNVDESLYIEPTSDGGVISAGATYSDDGDIDWKRGLEDIWVVKLFASGEVDWKQTYGGNDGEWSRCIRQTADGGYIVAATSTSTDGDFLGATNYGNADCFILKIDNTGYLDWFKNFGGSEWDDCFSVRQTSDGGYIVACATGSNGSGDVPAGYLGINYWILKLDANGNIVWNKIYGGNSHEIPSDIIQTKEGGYIIAGMTQSGDGMVTGFHAYYDVWIVKLAPDGRLEWQKALGGSKDDQARAILQTDDDGYLVSGFSSSSDGDVAVNHGGTDYWIVKLNEGGGILWEKSLGGSGSEYSNSLIRTAEGDYVTAGYSNSNDIDVSGNHEGNDYWVVKLDLSE